MSKFFIAIVLFISAFSACSSSSKKEKNEVKEINPVHVKISLEESSTIKDAVDIYGEFKRGKESNKRKVGTIENLKAGEYSVVFDDLILKLHVEKDGKMKTIPGVLENKALSFTKLRNEDNLFINPCNDFIKSGKSGRVIIAPTFESQFRPNYLPTPVDIKPFVDYGNHVIDIDLH